MPRHPSYDSPSTRTSVLDAVRSGPDAAPAAHARFFDRYAPYVFGVARARGLQEADADEVVQLVMLALLRDGGLAGYDRARGGFRPWLARLAAWRAEDVRRRGAVAPEPVAPETLAPLVDERGPAIPSPEAEASAWRAAAFDEALRRLRAELSPAHFAAFEASVLEGLPAEAAVRAAGVSRDNLYQIRRRAKLRFEALFAAALHDLEIPPLP